MDLAIVAETTGEGYFIGWGTLALINAGLAQGKNRSGLNWFIISVLLGPLATVGLLFQESLPPKQSAPERPDA